MAEVAALLVASASTTAAATLSAATAARSALGTEACLAINRAISAWNERHRGLLTATGALHYALGASAAKAATTTAVPTRLGLRAAGLATPWL